MVKFLYPVRKSYDLRMETRISGRKMEKQVLWVYEKGNTFLENGTGCQEFFLVFFPVELHSHWRCCWVRVVLFTFPSPFLGLRNPPRPLLVAGSSSTGSSDSDGGLFAVPTTLPPNSRHGKLFSPNKETELTFLQHLNSISVSAGNVPLCLPADRVCCENTQGLSTVFLIDAVGFLLAKAPETAEPAPTEASGGPGKKHWSGLLSWAPPGQAARRTDFLPCLECSTEMDNPCHFFPSYE